MGLRFGLIAVRAPVEQLVEAFPKVWPEFEIVRSQVGFRDAAAALRWMEENTRFVSARDWRLDDPGTQCLLFAQDGAWATMWDATYTLAGNETALQNLSRLCPTVLSFVVESSSACAFFWQYRSGSLRRALVNDGLATTREGEALPQEEGIDTSRYYLAETEALMDAFGLSSIERQRNLASATAVAVADRTDYRGQSGG